MCLFLICLEGHEFISILYWQVPHSKNKVDYYYYYDRNLKCKLYENHYDLFGMVSDSFRLIEKFSGYREALKKFSLD